METLRLSEVDIETATSKAAAVLRAGGVILYPTDTLYGLGADAFSDEAVLKVKRIKGRDENKPIHAIVADQQAAERYAIFNVPARMLAHAFWPGPLTLILEKKQGVENGIGRGLETFGVRVPDNEICLALAREFGKPYTGTSANKSGEESRRSVEDILTQLGKSAEDISLIIDIGELPDREPSTVVDVHNDRPAILREGAILAADIKDVLQDDLDGQVVSS